MSDDSTTEAYELTEPERIKIRAEVRYALIERAKLARPSRQRLDWLKSLHT